MDLHNDNPNDGLERLINRALDGELSGEERLELNRELIRRPDLRATMELSERIDAAAGPALRGLLDDAEGPRLTLPARRVGPAARGYHRAWWLMPGAAAAALAGLLWFGPASQDARPVARSGSVAPPSQRVDPVGNVRSPYGREGYPMQAGFQQPRIDRQLGRDVLGVVGSDGNLYLIETDHLRTVTQAGGGGRSLPIGGDL